MMRSSDLTIEVSYCKTRLYIPSSLLSQFKGANGVIIPLTKILGEWWKEGCKKHIPRSCVDIYRRLLGDN